MYFVPASKALNFLNLILSYQAAAKQMLSEDEEKKTKSFFTLRALLYVMAAYMSSKISGEKMEAYYQPKPWVCKRQPESWVCVTVAVMDSKLFYAVI